MAELSNSMLRRSFVVVLMSGAMMILNGCGPSNGSDDFLSHDEVGTYTYHEGLNCYGGHGAAVQEYVLQNISIDDCLAVCSNQTQCEAVVIERSSLQHVPGQCTLHTKVDLQACVQSPDHDLWLRRDQFRGDLDLDVPGINLTAPGFLKVLDGHDCWTPCGGKSGYCGACGRRTNMWRACCRVGQSDPICDRVDDSLKATDQYECVDVPSESYSNGVPWMRSFDVSFDLDMPPMAIGEGDATFKPTSSIDCNSLAIDRIAIAVIEPHIQLEGKYVGLDCQLTGNLTAFNGTIVAPVSVTAKMNQNSSVAAKIQMPVKARDPVNLTVADCVTDLHFDIDIKQLQTGSNLSLPDGVEAQAQAWIRNLTAHMLHAFGCAHLRDQLDMVVPQLEEHVSTHQLAPPDQTPFADDCYQICGRNSGWCPSCGFGQACCRNGFDSDVLACAMAVTPPSGAHHECVESSAEEPWLQSLAYRPDDFTVEMNWLKMCGKIAVTNLVCGGGSLRNLLVDVNEDGFSVHLIGLDFEITCSAQVTINGVGTSNIRARLAPGFHGRLDVHPTVDEAGQIGHVAVTKCHADIPWQIEVSGHWASWLLNGFVAIVQYAFGDKISSAVCEAVTQNDAIEVTLKKLISNGLKSHEFVGL